MNLRTGGAGNSEFTYESSDIGIATVSADGVATIKKPWTGKTVKVIGASGKSVKNVSVPSKIKVGGVSRTRGF